ncbi:hypothetical protein MNBD_PLANCTO02-2325 [hydrothermal vent metagenome]|uniref:DUF1501 domain-containing protein n=1 Tax=hydrothermal vent metagenome TaxID=652676 RepID=A0A3B1DPY6_9ZZZZ
MNQELPTEVLTDHEETMSSESSSSPPPLSRAEVSRRDFLRVGGLSVVGLTVAEKTARAQLQKSFRQRSCIFLMMNGGPSQLDTFDPKPDAPVGIRGPLKSIQTTIAGVHVSESLPRIAERAGQIAFLRSLHHTAAPIHETGMQLLNTGRLANREIQYPSFGSIVAQQLGARNGIAPYVVLPRLIDNTGVNAPRGQTAGLLGEEFEPVTESSGDQDAIFSELLPREPEAVRLQYGETRFGRLCLQARQLVESGVRSVVVNLFDSLDGDITWDAHGHKTASPGTIYDYRDKLCPEFDRAFSALIDDLQQRGLLDQTLIVATGEFGRTPKINKNSGRDHWTNAWSGIVAGGGISAGQVIGATDKYATEPIDRPIHPGELTATILDYLGVNLTTELELPDGIKRPLSDHQPITELFC